MARAAAKTASAGRWAAESTSGRKYHGTRYAPARPAQTRSSDGREEARAGRGRDALRERGRPRHGDRRDRDDPARPRAHHARDRRADLEALLRGQGAELAQRDVPVERDEEALRARRLHAAEARGGDRGVPARRLGAAREGDPGAGLGRLPARLRQGDRLGQRLAREEGEAVHPLEAPGPPAAGPRPEAPALSSPRPSARPASGG